MNIDVLRKLVEAMGPAERYSFMWSILMEETTRWANGDDHSKTLVLKLVAGCRIALDNIERMVMAGRPDAAVKPAPTEAKA